MDNKRMDFFDCNNCDKDLCDYDMFSCRCDKVTIDDKCNICESSGYDCECAECFIANCPIKKR